MLKKLILLSALFIAVSARAATNEELRIGTSQEFETLNPILMQMSASQLINGMAARTLVSITADWKWACWLCVDIPSLENSKAKIIEEGGKKKIVAEWEIKPNAKWADGTPVTGNDVKLSFEVGSSPNVSVGEKENYTSIEAIIVDPKNPKKFTIKSTDAKYNFSHLSMLYLIPEHLERAVWEKTKNQVGEYEKQTKYSTDSTNPGLYSGAYKVSDIVLGSHVVLEPNPYYYGDAPKIKKMVFKLISDTSTLEANLLSGTIDMIGEVGVTFNQALALEKRIAQDPELQKKFKVEFKDSVTFEHLDVNVRNPMLSDVRVRQALMYAIDRDTLTRSLFDGRQKKALHNIHPLDPYFTDDVTKYEYDAAKAATLLDASGWKMGTDGYRYKDGQKLSLSIMTTAGDKVRELVEVYLQGEWKKSGIELTIKNEPARVFFGETIRKGIAPALAMYASVASPDYPPRQTMHSSQVPTSANGYNGQNAGGWGSVVTDQTLDAIYLEFDFNKRKELMKTVQQIFTQEIPIIPLYWRADIVVIPANLKNFAITGHMFYSTLSAEKWTLE